VLGDASSHHLWELANGIDPREVVSYESPKSVSHEETFERDLDADQDILRELLDLAGRVGSRLREDGYQARKVVLKARLANFQTLTRSRTLPDPTDIGADLYRTVAELYSALPGQRRRIRLLGVQATGLVPAGAEQLALLHGERWGDVERTIDRIERRFGRGVARPASLIERDRRR
jgi:DNA polymerase-4